jgi:hypothetical protein
MSLADPLTRREPAALVTAVQTGPCRERGMRWDPLIAAEPLTPDSAG